MPRQALLMGLMVVMLILAGCAPHTYTGTVLDAAHPIEDFELPASDGGMFRLSEAPTKWVLVYFGYTFCPDICPTTVYDVSRMMDRLGKRADDVQFVMISVDPTRDTLDQLERYMTNFDESFLGLRTTDTQKLDAILADFGAYYEIEEPAEEGYLVSHTSSLFLIGPDMNLRAIFRYGTAPEDTASDIAHLMKTN